MDIKGKKILIVDDEEDLCEILQYNLGNEGYITEIAHSAEEAIKRPLEDFDLILLDVMMGAVSGFKFADMIRKELKLDIPVIFLTALTDGASRQMGELGGADFIEKPFDPKDLAKKIEDVLKKIKGKSVSKKG